MEQLIPLAQFTQVGDVLIWTLAAVAAAAGLLGSADSFRKDPLAPRAGGLVLPAAVATLIAGFIWICWFHWQIYQKLPLTLPAELAGYVNRQLEAMNKGAPYGLPLYDAARPPRYALPLWIENEKYYFWLLCYATMALIAWRRMPHGRFRALLHLGLAVQTAIVFFAANPFREPLPRFFAEVAPWFSPSPFPMEKIGLYMRLMPRMVFYYNAEYMWLHPPMLFIAYACMTLTFFASCLMLVRRELAVERLAYDFAKLGYFMLTVGMLLGYPWALKAWGPNWWWDPKICSSIMLWAVVATYLHTRLYANKPAMWYFSSFLGIIAFVAMIFTFLASFFFPGEHTFQ